AAALTAARGGAPAAAAAALYALGLLDEAAHLAISHWRERRDPAGWKDALEHLEQKLGCDPIDRVLLAFTEAFPSQPVYRGRVLARTWLAGATDGRSHREVALEELLLLSLANANPAAAPYRELFDDTALARGTAYTAVLRELETFLGRRAKLGEGGLSLVEFLRGPMRAAPDSLAQQLRFVQTAWAWLVQDLVSRMQ